VSLLILSVTAVADLIFSCCITGHLKLSTKPLSCLKLEQRTQITALPVSSLTDNGVHNIQTVNFAGNAFSV